LLTGVGAEAATAADCPGHPDALGTSRTLVVAPREHLRIGAMQYAETLPLEDHEVVLTFDDGPLPRNTHQILDILASQCVKATFFTVGQMARTYPEEVRKLRAAGHTVGTHSQTHPMNMKRLPIDRAQQEIDNGIASVTSALGSDVSPAPFFRIPGLSRTEGIEDYLASKGIQTWSADFPADDWRHISSSRVFEIAMRRLEDKRKGILLLHDIQARTVAALPKILHELKSRGYRIVHVMPATAELPATTTDPQQWQSHPTSETVPVAHWPKVPNFVSTDAPALPVPALPLAELEALARTIPLPQQASWPTPSPGAPDHAAIALPVPARSIFATQEKKQSTAAQGLVRSPHHAKHTIPTERQTKERERDGIARLISGERG
jgi:peptidoglycan/xylan/chitin deacetylase (PgdA/CDA1 family)